MASLSVRDSRLVELFLGRQFVGGSSPLPSVVKEVLAVCWEENTELSLNEVFVVCCEENTDRLLNDVFADDECATVLVLFWWKERAICRVGFLKVS
jgi:hypothetical protein